MNNTGNNEEIIEEITDTEETLTTDQDASIKNSDNATITQNKQAAQQNDMPTIDQEVINAPSAPVKKKSKAPILVILILLLILDIAALVIYIIGIDKVLSFIK